MCLLFKWVLFRFHVYEFPQEYLFSRARSLFKGVQLFIHKAKNPWRDAPEGIGKGILKSQWLM